MCTRIVENTVQLENPHITPPQLTHPYLMQSLFSLCLPLASHQGDVLIENQCAEIKTRELAEGSNATADTGPLRGKRGTCTLWATESLVMFLDWKVKILVCRLQENTNTEHN